MVRRLSSCGTQPLECKHQYLWPTGLDALWHVRSSWNRDWTHVSCIGRQILNHWTTREVPEPLKVGNFLWLVPEDRSEIWGMKTFCHHWLEDRGEPHNKKSKWSLGSESGSWLAELWVPWWHGVEFYQQGEVNFGSEFSPKSQSENSAQHNTLISTLWEPEQRTQPCQVQTTDLQNCELISGSILGEFIVICYVAIEN